MPGQPAPRAPSSLQRRIVAALTDQIGLKATAVFLALGLWFIENVKEPQTELVPVRLVLTLDSSLVLREPLPRLEALVAGLPKELIKLNSNLPIIRRQIAPDAPDSLAIELHPNDVMLPDGVDAVVREVGPQRVTLRFESSSTRRVPVQSAIDIATPSPLPGPLVLHIEPATVEVTGPRHLVGRVAFVRTTKTTLPFPDSLPHLVELDTTGLGAGVRLRPPQVKVLITLAPHR